MKFIKILNFTSVIAVLAAVVNGLKFHFTEMEGSPFVRASYGLAFVIFSETLKYFYSLEDQNCPVKLKLIRKLSTLNGLLLLNLAMTIIVSESLIFESP